MEASAQRAQPSDAPCAEVFERRPGVVLAEWLVKEGGTKLSSAFPSRRFCVLLDQKVEYYELRSAKLRLRRGGSAETGLRLNDWNLVMHVVPGHSAADSDILVGDVVTAVDGKQLGVNNTLDDAVASAPQAHTCLNCHH